MVNHCENCGSPTDPEENICPECRSHWQELSYTLLTELAKVQEAAERVTKSPTLDNWGDLCVTLANLQEELD